MLGVIMWTHSYNLLAKLFTSAIAIAIAEISGILIKEKGLSRPFILTLSICVTWPVYVFFLRHVANWIYARITLGTPVRWRDARLLQYLFTEDKLHMWLPMSEIVTLPREKRQEALVTAALQARTIRKLPFWSYYI